MLRCWEQKIQQIILNMQWNLVDFFSEIYYNISINKESEVGSMIKLSGRQRNTLIDALHCYYELDKRFQEEPSSSHYRDSIEASKYVEGVLDALGVDAYNDMEDGAEMWCIYPTEAFDGTRDANHKRIPILKVNSRDREVTFDLFNDEGSKEAAEKMLSGYKNYIKTFPESFEVITL